MTDLDFTIKSPDYKSLGLNSNPFPYSGIPDTSPDFYIGQEKAISTINRVIQTTLISGRSSHIIVTGSYGNGKSHTLKYLQSKVKENRELSDSNPITAYVSQPGDSFLEIYRECVYDIGSNLLQKIAQNYIGKICYELSEEGAIEEIIEINEGWKAIEEGNVLLSDVIPQALKRLNNIIKYPDFSRAFLNLAYEENSITSWEWLCAENIEYSRRRELKLTTNIGNKHVQRAFIALKSVFNETGYYPFILLIDEFEYIESLPRKNKYLMLNSIRHLIDTIPNGLVLLIACAPEIWETLISDYHAFSDRIAHEVNLRPLTRDNVKDLIIAYLNRSREKSFSINPFTNDGLMAAYEQGHGNARRIMTICGLAIDKALEESKIMIDQDLILSVIEGE